MEIPLILCPLIIWCVMLVIWVGDILLAKWFKGEPDDDTAGMMIIISLVVVAIYALAGLGRIADFLLNHINIKIV